MMMAAHQLAIADAAEGLIQKQQQANRDAALRFLEEMLGEPFEWQNIQPLLKDGVRLCKLMNRVKPGCIPRISLRSLPFMQMENISNFLDAARNAGVHPQELFCTLDLYEGKDLQQVVVCLLAIARLCGMADTNRRASDYWRAETLEFDPETHGYRLTVGGGSRTRSIPNLGSTIMPSPTTPASDHTATNDPGSPNDFRSLKRNSITSHSSTVSLRTSRSAGRKSVLSKEEGSEMELRERSRAGYPDGHVKPEPIKQRRTVSAVSGGLVGVDTGVNKGLTLRDRGDTDRWSSGSHKRASTVVGDLIIIGPYQLGQVIGRGQYGVVYTAFDTRDATLVAIKRINLAEKDERDVAELMREVELLKSLSHPYIVQYRDFIQADDYLNIILEWVEHGSLQKIIKTYGALVERHAASYVAKLLEGLVYLHEQNVVHHDIKCANILTTKTGEPKLSDFGVSRQLDALDKGTMAVVGTPCWMAPEIIELKGASTKSDIWSLGCTVVEMVTGKPPYFDLQPMTALFRIVEDKDPPIPPNVSPELADFLRVCFEKNPFARASARDLSRHTWLKLNDAIICPESPLLPTTQITNPKSSISTSPDIPTRARNSSQQSPSQSTTPLPPRHHRHTTTPSPQDLATYLEYRQAATAAVAYASENKRGSPNTPTADTQSGQRRRIFESRIPIPKFRNPSPQKRSKPTSGLHRSATTGLTLERNEVDPETLEATMTEQHRPRTVFVGDGYHKHVRKASEGKDRRRRRSLGDRECIIS
ncbi:kinase-like domain-containing protein [Cladochytrium replicatum]|nr:kinase-like domain-containing protein [Cladochytrium replicatum]